MSCRDVSFIPTYQLVGSIREMITLDAEVMALSVITIPNNKVIIIILSFIIVDFFCSIFFPKNKC